MNKLATALTIGLTLATVPALADEVTDARVDLAICTEIADARTQNTSYPSTTNVAIGAAANLLGALIGGRDPSYALSGAAQQGVYGVANDARMAANQRRLVLDQCLRERTLQRRTEAKR